MRTHSLTVVTTAVAAIGMGALALGAAGPAAASSKPVSSSYLKALSTQINKGKKLTYYVTYKTVGEGSQSTVTIAQAPPKTYFASSGSTVFNNGKTTYYCSPGTSDSGDSGSSGSGNSGDSGDSGNSGATTTTAAPKATLQCYSEKGNNPLADTEDLFTGSSVLSIFSEAEEGTVARLLGIKVSQSSGNYAGQPSTCITVSRRGQSAKYCVTKQGLLSYSSASGTKGYFEMTKYSSHPPSSLFSLPSGATTVTIPSGA
jgi:hypothetical protein